MKTLILWFSNAPRRSLVASEVRRPVALQPGGSRPFRTVRLGGSPLVVPAPAPGALCGALLVPDPLSGQVSLRGRPLGARLHALRHGDSIAFAGAAFWVSLCPSPEEASFDPARHGPVRFCARTKARLAAGDPVVFCPGTPAAACEQVFRASVWQPGLVCPACGFEAGGPEWRPPLPPARSRLEALLELGRARRA